MVGWIRWPRGLAPRGPTCRTLFAGHAGQRVEARTAKPTLAGVPRIRSLQLAGRPVCGQELSVRYEVERGTVATVWSLVHPHGDEWQVGVGDRYCVDPKAFGCTIKAPLAPLPLYRPPGLPPT